jgi:membrane-associated protein
LELIAYFIDLFIHLDIHLNTAIQFFGIWVYLVVFLVIFCETGLVITPILPGDSLLFALGAISALEILDARLLTILLTVAAVTGDAVNFSLGKFIGPRIFHYETSRFFKKEYLHRTHSFYEKHGGKTIFLARFIPIIRTFAPFVAGIGKMSYGRFAFYNITGGVSWIVLFIAAGYYFGNIPVIKHNFSLVIIAIVFISILPGIIELWRRRTA